MTMVNQTTHENAIINYDAFLNNFRSFLDMHGIDNPNLFTSIKYAGGSRHDRKRFIAIIPYVIQDNTVYVIMVPYQRKQSPKPTSARSSEIETDFHLLQYEALQEIGIKIKSSDQRNLQLLHETLLGEGGMEQAFYGYEITPNQAKRRKRFQGFNWYDDEKGMPLYVRLCDGWKFLPTAHLKATLELLLYLRRHVNVHVGIYNQKAFYDRCTEMVDKIRAKIDRREKAALHQLSKPGLDHRSDEIIKGLRA